MTKNNNNNNNNKKHSKKKKSKKAKWWSEEALQIGKKRSDRQGRKGNKRPTEYRVPENSKEGYKGLLKRTMKRNIGKQ